MLSDNTHQSLKRIDQSVPNGIKSGTLCCNEIIYSEPQASGM